MNVLMKKHSGSCLCGRIKFEIEGDFNAFYLCHCTYCQKDTGSAHAANLFSAAGVIHWLGGEDKVKTFNLPSTRHMKSFCQNCGSALPTRQPTGLVVPAGSLDGEVRVKPDAHIFFSSKATWNENLESLKKFETFPG